MKILKSSRLVLLLALLALEGCAIFRGTDPTRHYVLRGLSGSDDVEPVARRPGLRIELTSVRVAGYLDRAEIVTRSGANEVRVDPVHRWAEELDKGIGRLTGENLSILLGTTGIISGSGATISVDYQLDLVVMECEGSLTGPVRLVVAWSLLDAVTSKVVAADRAVVVAPVSDAGAGDRVAAYVDAIGDAVNQCSREVARELAKLPRGE